MTKPRLTVWAPPSTAHGSSVEAVCPITPQPWVGATGAREPAEAARGRGGRVSVSVSPTFSQGTRVEPARTSEDPEDGAGRSTLCVEADVDESHRCCSPVVRRMELKWQLS